MGFRLQWEDHSDSERGFHIERKGSEIAQVPTDTTSFEDMDLSEGSTFCYRVRAGNDAVTESNSKPTATASVIVPICAAIGTP